MIDVYDQRIRYTIMFSAHKHTLSVGKKEVV